MIEAWYVAQLKSRSEFLAEQNLTRQGFAVWTPKIRRTCRRGGIFRDELQPLFPGYLFVGSSALSSPFRAIGSTVGVRRLIGFGNEGPALVPAEVIDALRSHYGDTGRTAAGQIEKGDRVRVIAGPLAEIIATVDALPGADRVRLLLNVLGQWRRVSMPLHQILPA